MINQVLFYTAAFLLCAWGIAHLVPTRSVVRGFGEISRDNQRIVTMEWIIEGVSLIFIGLLVAAVTMVDPGSTLAKAVYWLCIVELNALSVVSLLTGFGVRFLPFRLCPVILTGSSILILLGNLL